MRGNERTDKRVAQYLCLVCLVLNHSETFVLDCNIRHRQEYGKSHQQKGNFEDGKGKLTAIATKQASQSLFQFLRCALCFRFVVVVGFFVGEGNKVNGSM